MMAIFYRVKTTIPNITYMKEEKGQMYFFLIVDFIFKSDVWSQR